MRIQTPLLLHHNVLFLLLLLFLVANELLVTVPTVVGQEQEQASAKEPDLEMLESMSDDELELICVERGFELIRDDSQGELTHADFVDAAQRCLAIEEDM